MNFYILTLFPEMVMNGLSTSITGRAIESGKLHIEAINIRDYTQDKHNHVDDYPYGGGAGMVMQAQPVYDAYTALVEKFGRKPWVIYMTPQGRTFNQETTLPGMVMVSQLSDAKKAGYTIVLYFVGVQGVEIAINRVKKRIERGGHGISEEVIRKRYVNMPKALSKILPLCDRAFFYDNTERFRQIAYIENNNFADIDPNLPDWFYYVTGRSNGKQ